MYPVAKFTSHFAYMTISFCILPQYPAFIKLVRYILTNTRPFIQLMSQQHCICVSILPARSCHSIIFASVQAQYDEPYVILNLAIYDKNSPEDVIGQ